MALVGDLDLPAVDYTDPELRGPRFHATMKQAASGGWLAAGSPFGYIVLDRAAATFFLRSRAVVFPGMVIADALGIESGPLYEEMRRNIINIDGDDHRRLRNLVNPAFTSRAADRHRPALAELIEELLRSPLAAGRCEFVSAVARPYPARAIAMLLGAPPEDAERLAEWSNLVQRQFDVVALRDERERIEAAVVELVGYLEQLLERRRAEPGEDLISELLRAEAAGERLTALECLNLVLDVLIGGIDTTQAQLAQTMRLLAEHPAQWALLREDPELAPGAVEEALRFEPITPFTARMTTEAVEYRGVQFPEGTLVLVSAVTGNRDGSDGERFDIAAPREGRPLTFGAGIHNCLGANLARAELQEALGFMARRVGRLELDGDYELDGVTGIYGLRRLPLVLEPA